jgi:hypothetical protein
MDESQQEHLDEQVSQAMRELQADGEHPTVESVARKVGRRTEAVLHAVRRLTRGTPAPDMDTPPESYPGVVQAVAKMDQLSAALAQAGQALQEAEAAYAQAEAQAAEALIDGREPISLMEAQQAVLHAAETVHLLELAQSTAKDRHTTALAAAQAQHWAAQWRRYQGAIAAFDAALGAAYHAQEAARQVWNEIGQPGTPPILTTALANWPEHFHPFLQAMILDMPPEQVRRGGNVPPMLQSRPY